MNIKLIVCKVPVSSKDNFSSAQKKWIRTKSAKGFIAQAGGWNLNDDNEACIISLWESKDALKFFMQSMHDNIVSESRQEQFYSTIIVSHFNILLKMEGNSSTITESINDSEILRIAECNVKSSKVEHFEEMQRTIWAPGMKTTQGMLSGTFSQSVIDNNKYLVSTFWKSKENHNYYANYILPGLRQKADELNDLDTITGKQIILIDSWKVNVE